MTELPPYRARIEPGWIDYNGHLRDAYYCVVMSYAVDDVMEHLGLDAAYRERTRCTLYTVELYMSYAREIKGSDELVVRTSILDSDRKRIHAGCDFLCPGIDGAAATAELMLLHVQQGGTPSVVPFPREIEQRLERLRLSPEALAKRGAGSRRIEIRRR